MSRAGAAESSAQGWHGRDENLAAGQRSGTESLQTHRRREMDSNHRLRRCIGSASARTPAFKWVNTALGNIKASIVGTYRSINSKHVPRYLAEFEYRFNRRYDLAAMMPCLCWSSVRTTPIPYWLLKLAEVYS